MITILIRIITLTVATILFSIPITKAQVFEANLGQNNKGPEYFTKYTKHIGKHENYYYNVYMNGYGKVYLEKIDSNFNLISNTLISKDISSAGGTSSGLFHVTLLNGKVQMFYEKTEKDEKQIVCNLYDVSGVMLESKVLTSMPYTRMSERDFPSFMAKESKNGQHLAIASSLGYRTKKLLQIQLLSINLGSLEVTNSKLFTNEIAFKFISSINDVELSVDGKIAASILVKNEKTSERVDYLYYTDGDKIQYKVLEDEQSSCFYTDVEFKSNDELDIAGCYRLKQDKESKMEGFYFGNIQIETLTMTLNDTLTFSDKYANFLYGINVNQSIDRLVRAGCYEVEIVSMKDNKTYVLIEHRCSFISSSRELVVLLINDRKIEQKWVIPKHFVYNQGDGCSYFVQNEELKILYNDNSENLNAKNLGDSKKIRQSFDETACVVACKIKPYKPEIKQLLLRVNNHEGQLIPLFAGFYDDKVFITLNKKNNRKYGLLTTE